MCMRRIILSSVACLAVEYFSTSHTRQDFRGEKCFNIQCVFCIDIRTVHLDIIKVLFIHRLMQK